MSEADRQGGRMRERVFSLINSTAGSLGFTECWALIDDGLFTCGDREAFAAALRKPHTLTQLSCFSLCFAQTALSLDCRKHTELQIFRISVLPCFSMIVKHIRNSIQSPRDASSAYWETLMVFFVSFVFCFLSH